MQPRKIWPWIACGALALLLVLRFTVFGLYRIPAGSMIPALGVGDHVIINMLNREPKRGEIMVFKYPKEPDKDFVKRVVGVGGDTVEIRDGALYVNGALVPSKPLAEPTSYKDEDGSGHTETYKCRAFEETLDGRRYTILHTDDQARSFKQVSVPPGEYFVMGDNRDNSHDSRYWGFVPKDHVRGTLLWVWYSSSR